MDRKSSSDNGVRKFFEIKLFVVHRVISFVFFGEDEMSNGDLVKRYEVTRKGLRLTKSSSGI
jgi:hypothetical protein